MPQVQDNYGVDSCGILVLPTLPPTVVIAESSGKLHHAVLVETEVEGFKNTVRIEWENLSVYLTSFL